VATRVLDLITPAVSIGEYLADRWINVCGEIFLARLSDRTWETSGLDRWRSAIRCFRDVNADEHAASSIEVSRRPSLREFGLDQVGPRNCSGLCDERSVCRSG
jgi:hypothetical protein